MEFDKPLVLPSDISTIMALYPFGQVLECENLGGIPNTTYKVVAEKKVIVVRIYSHGQSSFEHIQLEMKVLRHLASLGFESPRVLPGTNGEILQQWRGYWVCASEFIKGSMADTIKLTPKLVADVGRLVVSFQRAMSLFEIDEIPVGETIFEKGTDLLKSLAPALGKKGWKMDVRHVIPQWERACEPFIANREDLESNIIHADIWPPNVICEGEKVVGLIDFDDCCYGATIIDVAIALMEFAMFRNVVMDEQLAVSFITGYLRHGGTISALEEKLIIPAMEMTCAMWLAYNVLQAPVYEEAEIYLRRLNVLYSASSRNKMIGDIAHFIATAREMNRSFSTSS